MRLLQTRDDFTIARTLGRLSVQYEHGLMFTGLGWRGYDTEPEPAFFGYTCEDRDRGLDKSWSLALTQQVKVPHETAIGTGVYRVIMAWSPKHGRMVPHVLGVTGYVAIEIHPGNLPKHTDGCVLPGTHRELDGVSHSTVACAWLDARITECEKRHEDVFYESTREPTAWATFQASLETVKA